MYALSLLPECLCELTIKRCGMDRKRFLIYGVHLNDVYYSGGVVTQTRVILWKTEAEVHPSLIFRKPALVGVTFRGCCDSTDTPNRVELLQADNLRTARVIF